MGAGKELHIAEEERIMEAFQTGIISREVFDEQMKIMGWDQHEIADLADELLQ